MIASAVDKRGFTTFIGNNEQFDVSKSNAHLAE